MLISLVRLAAEARRESVLSSAAANADLTLDLGKLAGPISFGRMIKFRGQIEKLLSIDQFHILRVILLASVGAVSLLVWVNSRYTTFIRESLGIICHVVVVC